MAVFFLLYVTNQGILIMLVLLVQPNDVIVFIMLEFVVLSFCSEKEERWFCRVGKLLLCIFSAFHLIPSKLIVNAVDEKERDYYNFEGLWSTRKSNVEDSQMQDLEMAFVKVRPKNNSKQATT